MCDPGLFLLSDRHHFDNPVYCYPGGSSGPGLGGGAGVSVGAIAVGSGLNNTRIRNKITGEHEEPDEKLMREVEKLLDSKGTPEDARKGMISAIAAWAIDHPGAKVEPKEVFPDALRRMRESMFSGKKRDVALLTKDVVIHVREADSGLDAERKMLASLGVGRLVEKFGYCSECAADMASVLLRKRFGDLL